MRRRLGHIARSPAPLALALMLLVPSTAAAQSMRETLRDEAGERPAAAPNRSAPAEGEPPGPSPEAAPLDPSLKGPATPLTDIPVPAGRPGEAPAAEEPPDRPSSPTDAPTPVEPPAAGRAPSPAPEDLPVPPAPSPAGAAPVSASPPAQNGEGDVKDAGQDGKGEEPPAPVPAYVPPAEARTRPEPDAPLAPSSDVTPQAAVEAAAAIEDAQLCEAELERRGVEFEIGPSLADGDCGVLRPVSVTRLSSGATVSPETQFLCRTALAFDIWVSDGVVPAAADGMDGASVEAVQHASTYTCRSRVSEARISEHSRGSAIDIAAIDLSGGRSIKVVRHEPGSPEDRFLADIRRAACGPFKTVLGPGTDADHESHFHLDIAARSNGSTYCR